jgi:hypothetical protein
MVVGFGKLTGYQTVALTNIIPFWGTIAQMAKFLHNYSTSTKAAQ